jgi:hypothetical protein
MLSLAEVLASYGYDAPGSTRAAAPVLRAILDAVPDCDANWAVEMAVWPGDDEEDGAA